MRKQIIRLISMMTVFALILACVPALADGDDGWVSITIGEQEGVTLEIFLIATGNYGDWTMTDDFSDITVFTRDDGAAHIDITLGQIRKRIEDRRIRPTQTGTSDQSGKIEFKNLPRGIYFVMMPDEMENLQVSPMLLSAPNKDGSVQIRVVAKYEVITPTPSPTPTPRPSLTPFVPDEPTPTPTPPITPTPGDETPTPEPSRTPAPATRVPVATPEPEPNPEQTPIPKHAKQLLPKVNETVVHLEDYETALGLGNIQMHVGVCFD